MKTSKTYGELPRNIQELIEPHEWDNKDISEQRDWLIVELTRAQNDTKFIDQEEKGINAWYKSDKGYGPKCVVGWYVEDGYTSHDVWFGNGTEIIYYKTYREALENCNIKEF